MVYCDFDCMPWFLENAVNNVNFYNEMYSAVIFFIMFTFSTKLCGEINIVICLDFLTISRDLCDLIAMIFLWC